MTDTHPNILFLLADDQGSWAMRCAGNPDIDTPNLDRLAESGIRLKTFSALLRSAHRARLDPDRAHPLPARYP